MRYFNFSEMAHSQDHRMYFNLLARDRGLRLTWIPKNMCTSLKLTFLLSEGVVPRDRENAFKDNAPWIHDWTFFLEPKSALELISGKYESFAVVRDPRARLLSALFDKVLYEYDDYFKNVVWPMMQFYAPYIPTVAEAMTVGQFLKFIEVTPDRMLDVHFQSQGSCLSGSYQSLFVFERPDEIANFLAKYDMTMFNVAPHSIRRDAKSPMSVSTDSGILDLRMKLQEGVCDAFIADISLEIELERIVGARSAEDFALWQSLKSGPSNG
jgi:hypothetical protein